MRNFGILVRTNLRIFIGSLKNKRKGRYVATGILLGFGLLALGLSLAFQAVSQMFLLRDAGIPDVGIFMSLVSALMLGGLFGLMRSLNAPGGRDGELLLSLPVRRTTAVLSKVVSQYIFDAPLMFMIFLPSVISYFVLANPDPGVLLRGIFLCFLLPLFPIALAYLLGSAVYKLTQKFKMASLFSTALMMLLIFAYMGVNFLSSSILAKVTDNGPAGASQTIERVPPLAWLTNFVVRGDVLPFFLSLAMILLPFIAGVFLFSFQFGRPVARYRSGRRDVIFKSRSPRRALYGKEIRRYLGCPIYVINTAFGPVFMLGLSIVLLVMGPEKILAGVDIPMTDLPAGAMTGLVPAILFAIISFMPAVTSTSSVAISLEGQKLWILRAHPVRTEDIFTAKAMVNMTVMAPAFVLSLILVGIRLSLSPILVLGMCFSGVLQCALLSSLGLVINLFYPKFDWENETQVVKQSMSVIVNMVAGLFVSAVPFVIFFVAMSDSSIGILVLLCALVYAILFAGSSIFLKTAGKRMFLRL